MIGGEYLGFEQSIITSEVLRLTERKRDFCLGFLAGLSVFGILALILLISLIF